LKAANVYTRTDVTAHDFDMSILGKTSHRPWPMPDTPWVMTQTWHDLLFAHWPINPAQLARKIPQPFELDLFDGMAWLGIVPFHMTNVAPRGVPSLPWISTFAELNVRTYVRVDDRPGIYFFSLDAGSALAVKAARALFNLPYHTARMFVSKVGEGLDYRSARESDDCTAEFDAAYEPAGPSFGARPGTLEFFLTERYCLYHHDDSGAPYRLNIHHPPWTLQIASAQLRTNTMARANELDAVGAPSLLHFARRQDMVAWMPSPIWSDKK
jgi:uncharacterized protein YqjF (DUF2071 family)